MKDYHPEVQKLWLTRNEEPNESLDGLFWVSWVKPQEPIDFDRMRDIRKVMLVALKSISPREAYVVWHRIALEKTCKQVAKELGLTTAGVRYIERRALRKLKYPNRGMSLAPFSNWSVENYSTYISLKKHLKT